MEEFHCSVSIRKTPSYYQGIGSPGSDTAMLRADASSPVNGVCVRERESWCEGGGWADWILLLWPKGNQQL